MHITKEGLGIQTRKHILYLDHHVFSSAFKGKGPQWWAEAMRRITELLDLQLLAIPYSPTHVAEADFYPQRDDLLSFIQRTARGHRFEARFRVEETQILKAFQGFLANAPAAYVKEDGDALPSSVHDWDGPYFVSVSTAAKDVLRRRAAKKRSSSELVTSLSQWAKNRNTFEQDVEIELRDSAGIFIDAYTKKTARLYAGDFAARIDSPINASVVEYLMEVVKAMKVAPATIGSFFQSKHFAETPSQQLSARIFSAFKQRARNGAYPNSETAREKLSGFLFDVEHAATYAPYCDAYFTDRFMADLLNDKRVAVERDFGCKVFSISRMKDLFAWLEDVKASMTEDHADGLSWAYARYRPTRNAG